MIEGLTILKQTPIAESNDVAAIIAAFIAMIIVIIIGESHRLDSFITTMILIAVGVVVTVIVYYSTSEPTGRYKYECLISPEVTAVELYELYNIVEKSGELYILEDKED